MKPSLRKLVTLLFLAGLSTTAVLATPGYHPHPGGNPQTRREVHEYVNTNVLPLLRQQRQKLETELAPADQTQLATYRTQLKDLNHRAQALHQSARAKHLALPAPDSAARVLTHRPPQSAEGQAVRTERRAIMQHVAQLAQKYEANITRLAGEIQPQQTQWSTDLKAIVVKNSTPEQQEHLARFQGMAGRFSGLHKLLKASAFLLMDPGATGSLPSVAAGTSLYPNPVAATSQLQYEVKEAGPVTVELLDKTGNTLRTVVAASREKGTYQEALSLSDLPSGTYYYKVTTRANTETKRFVKE